MPRGRFGSTPERRAFLRSIASQGGQAEAVKRQQRAEIKYQVALLGLTKAEAYQLGKRIGYKAGWKAGSQRRDA